MNEHGSILPILILAVYNYKEDDRPYHEAGYKDSDQNACCHNQLSREGCFFVAQLLSAVVQAQAELCVDPCLVDRDCKHEGLVDKLHQDVAIDQDDSKHYSSIDVEKHQQ